MEVSLNAFLASFHNSQRVIQCNEVEAFSLWKLVSRQGQGDASRKKAKSRQSKCPAGTEASLAPASAWGLPLLSPNLVSALWWGTGPLAGIDAKKQHQGQVAKDDHLYLVLQWGVRPMNMPPLCVQRTEEDIIEPFAKCEHRVQWHVSRDHAKLILQKIIKLCDSLSQEIPQ